MNTEPQKFAEAIGIGFTNIDFLIQAFTHRSYLNEHREISHDHNERLEFLGDAVLELVVTNFLYKTFPGKPEGELTAYRAALVNTTTLSDAAKKLGMNDYLLLSKGEAKDTGRARQYILANTFEAVIGAIYLDQGYDVATDFITTNLLYLIKEIVAKNLWQDAKSFFQEKAQEVEGVTPAYEVLKQIGPDHNKCFTVGVYLRDELVAEGEGHSKQEAEQEAAKGGLEKKGWG
ncbi:MAG: ribonuclease III [Candidatus Vogelbacteria bacterium RIFOXYD1_FULL_44_32]|uniref:Ribonuclease 3 n=1 Tax=Candidatus Vogelbacteria bacterium RIFOXYD1_FULL_44_32 TaxID=1802438 RepID=A0A1G2QCV1_9BACT|nr:MAG: ribonuclease III [Candidatus Vogelbacteria bacterium RIFOXYD1_FULL_44_32]